MERERGWVNIGGYNGYNGSGIGGIFGTSSGC